MKNQLELQWSLQSKRAEKLDSRLFQLIRAVRDNGSLTAAAEAADISYRHAWNLMHEYAEIFGIDLVKMEKGRGACLTELGEKLLWAEEMINSRLQGEFNHLADTINDELDALMDTRGRPARIRINASHDLAIAEFQHLCQSELNLRTDFHFRGSIESLRELSASRCDVAGFHFPDAPEFASLKPLFRQWLDDEKYRLLLVCTRTQGIMTRAGNPKRIRSIRDLTKRAVRFVNRQADSGSRIIFDELLKQQQVDPAAIKGYDDEEFTHIAVAAMVASAAADAGFGISAAAARFKLDFQPLVNETYLLAVSKQLPDESVRALQKILRSRKFRQTIESLPGYDVSRAGTGLTAGKLFVHSD